MATPDPRDEVRRYHQRTKHFFDRYAAGPGFLDWATQPDPFRRFTGTEHVALPLAADRQQALYADLFQPGKVPAQLQTVETVGALLELTFGLSAWKSHGGDRWALRCNPSSGNLHPTEGYLVAGRDIRGLERGVYHYQSHAHVLEQRCRIDWTFPGLLVGVSSIHWREAWKYGERAFRYCQHDIGHALGALRYAAAVLGWKVRLLDDWSDADLARLLGLDRDEDFGAAEREVPDLLCGIGPAAEETVAPERLLQEAAPNAWKGQANILSTHHSHHWPVIEQAHRATLKPRTEPSGFDIAPLPLLPTPCEIRAADLIRQRRSAQAFDGITSIPANALWRILDATLPHPAAPPFDTWPYPPRVSLLLFLHRVVGLPPGLYVFCRADCMESELRQVIRGAFDWTAVDDCPDHLRLYRLVRANAQRAAKQLSCHQDIAGESAFSAGMLAAFDEALAIGPWMYRRLFWECGLIGQVLYLEAEAAGVRGTGIGCYFDDPVHELLGLTDTRYQSLYHFTIGGPLDDARLQTLPPYAHLRR